MTRALLTIGSVALTLLPACGSDGDDGGAGAGNPSLSCAPGEYALEGTVGGEAIAYRGALGNHAWIQGSTQSTFDGSFDQGGSVHTEWEGVVADGGTIAVVGWVIFPSGGTLGGDRLEGGSGSMMKRDDGVRFEMTALSRSVQCITAPCPPEEVDGTVSGCAEWEPFVF